MAKKTLKKNKPRKQVNKPEATPEQIQDMARRYREIYPGMTYEDIFNQRDQVHREMAGYSNKQGIENELRDYNEGEVLSPYESIFPGYRPITDFEGNIIGYELDPEYVGRDPYADFSPEQQYVEPSTQVNEPVNEPVGGPVDEYIEEINESKDNEVPDDSLNYVRYIPTVPEINLEPSANLKPNANVKGVSISVNRDITSMDELVDDSSPAEPEYSLNDQEYFPTTLNSSTYSPKIMEQEPQLSDTTYSRIYDNRTPSKSKVRRKVLLPGEIFANMDSLSKIIYELQKMQQGYSSKGPTPEAIALQNYAYEQLYPTYTMQHPLTYEQWTMHPISYPSIPKLGLFFNPINRKYVSVRN